MTESCGCGADCEELGDALAVLLADCEAVGVARWDGLPVCEGGVGLAVRDGVRVTEGDLEMPARLGDCDSEAD